MLRICYCVDNANTSLGVTDDSNIIKINLLIENINLVVNYRIIIQPLQMNNAHYSSESDP